MSAHGLGYWLVILATACGLAFPRRRFCSCGRVNLGAARAVITGDAVIHRRERCEHV
jgi:hypothetical protein